MEFPFFEALNLKLQKLKLHTAINLYSWIMFGCRGGKFLGVLLLLLLIGDDTSYGFVHSREALAACPLLHGEAHPDNFIPCNGVNRTKTQVWDPRDLFNVTGREALTLIDAIRDVKGDCSKAVVDGKKLIPLLNMRFNGETYRHIMKTALRTANLVSDLLNKGACNGNLEETRFYGDPSANLSDSFLFSVLRSNMQADDLILASGIWFLKGKYKKRVYFAPYAYKKKVDQHVRVKDLSTSWGEAHTSFLPFLEKLAKNRTFLCQSSYFSPRKNQSASLPARTITHAFTEYIDGLWGRPYFECGTTKAWTVGYFAPFFATRYDKPADDPLEMMGVATVDIDLSKVDINQCNLGSSGEFTYEIFAGTHHCKNDTTRCVHVPGGGFAVGSYRCYCKRGFYFPHDSTTSLKYFNGTEIETDLSKRNGSEFNKPNTYRCIKCRTGCETCVDGSPCVFEFDMEMRWIILGFSIFCILAVVSLSIFVWRCRNVKVIKSASPLFLQISLLGAGLMYMEAVVLFPSAENVICTVAAWLQHVGFILMYGSVLLKTWRVSLIFKIKVTKRVKVSDMGLLQRLTPLVLFYVVYLIIWTVAGHPVRQKYHLINKVPFYACTESWWDHSIAILDIMLLFWGIHLCYTVRKAPTPFNESKYISWSIYNMTLVSALTKLINSFLIRDLGPDTIYILVFARIQLSVTVLVVLVFFPKILRVVKGHGDEDASASKSRSAGGSSDGTMHLARENETLKAEITRLYSQLETMKHARMEAGNRPLNRNGSIAACLHANSAVSLHSVEKGNGTSTTSLADGWRNGGSQYFSPAAELVSDFV